MVIQPGRLQIFATRLAGDETDARVGRQLRLIMPGKTHPLGAAAFKKLQVIGVINDAAGIGILVIDANGNRKGVGFWLKFHRPILPCIATIFCNDLFPQDFDFSLSINGGRQQ